jgi:hypothetical protein
MRRVCTLLLALAAGCPSDDAGNGVLRPPPDPTFGTSTSTTAVAPTSDDGTGIDTDGAACSAEAPCSAGLFCVAPSAGGAVVFPGEYTCSDACVADDDPTRWCLDDASCCGGRTCSNGLCDGDEATTTDDPSTSTTTDGPTGTGDGTGTDDATGTDDGTGTDDATSSSGTATSGGESTSDGSTSAA